MTGNAKRQAFYKSHRWEDFVAGLRITRAQSDGTLICEHCGEPILHKYDCIAHHKIELTEENVDDVMISLNPENIMLVHFRCHNTIHKRFGYGGRPQKRVYLVYGAPCSGKTTWVRENAEPSDLILDIDRLWNAVRAESCGPFEKPNALKGVIFDLRDALLDMIRVRRGKWQNAYIIGGYPIERERERLIDAVGVDHVVYIDTPREVCTARARLKAPEWIGFVEDWFDRSGK